MALPVLVTKLYVPPPHPRVVPRHRLIARLTDGLHRRLTLVSAPAGFGKTTLVSEWIAGIERSVAWLSLDEADSDPARFLSYLIAAVRTVVPALDGDISSAAQGSPPASPELILTALVNEISALPAGIVLVLDDYHTIDAPAVDDALAFLLDHLPSRLHLVIVTREDPRLPLARLRARGQLAEVRAADLRFTATEAAEFLNQAMGLDMPETAVAALEGRTEGWIAGLQLAAISMQGQVDATGFVQSFTGSNRYVMDYLVDEVLQQQPARVQDFLLRTSILDQLCGALCDAVLLDPGVSGQGILEQIERANLFLIPLDNERRWFRYHHLFAELLRQRLHEAAASDSGDGWNVAVLHGRASAWYERNGAMADAIRHALAAGDSARAADLVEPIIPIMNRNRQEATLLGWLRAIPDDLFPSRPVLSLGYAGVLLSSGEIAGAEERLRDAERWLDPPGPVLEPNPLQAGPIVVDDAQFRRLPGGISVYRAGLALVQGDAPTTAIHARHALDLIPGDDHLWRGAASALFGLALWTRGELDDAYSAYADGMASLKRAGNIADVIGGALALADIRLAQGRLRDATRIFERGLQLAVEHETPVIRGTADMYVGLGDLSRERGDLETARQYLLRSREQGDHTGFPQHRYRWHLAMARIREAEGDLDAALDLLGEAERAYVSDFYPNVRPVAAFRTRILVAQDRLDDAHDWVDERGLTVDDDLDYLREFEHITLARVLIAQSRRDEDDRIRREAGGLLARLLHVAGMDGRTGSAIEILVLQALVNDVAGDVPHASGPLGQALALAEPEGYVQIFVAEGPPMARLLTEASRQGVRPDYASRLLTAFEVTAHPQSAPARTIPLDGLLSQREVDVMRLIMRGHSNKEIGEQLFLALDTVKGHNRRIFAKLGVQTRTGAIARARDLGLDP